MATITYFVPVSSMCMCMKYRALLIDLHNNRYNKINSESTFRSFPQKNPRDASVSALAVMLSLP